MSSRKSVILSSLKMAVATFLSRILGLVREQVMAFMFGASGFTDAYNIAFRIPNLLRDLFAEGAFSAAFVPSFIDLNQKDPREARKLLWSLFIFLFIITGIISILTFIFASNLISLFAPSFVNDPEKFAITVTLTKIMSPFLIFVSLAALMMGALNSLKVFFIPALAPAFFNITMILSMLIMPAILSDRGIPIIYSLGVGVLVGGFVQFCIQLPLIYKKGFITKLKWNGFHSDSSTVIKKLGPGLLGFAATQINLIITTIIASGTLVGAVSWLNYAFRLFQLPVGILSVSLGNSNLVHFASAWKKDEKDIASSLLVSSYFTSWFIMLPALLVMMLFSTDIVELVFERGAFTSESTKMTSLALIWYALGLPFYGVYKLMVPCFYTLDKQKIPVYTSVVTIAINVVFCLTLTPVYGFAILAAGTSLSMLINSSALTILMSRSLNRSFFDFFNLRLLKIIILTCAIYYIFGTLKVLYPSFGDGLYFKALYLLCGLLSTSLTYIISLILIGEGSTAVGVIKKIFKK